jgi:hypothetical protein
VAGCLAGAKLFRWDALQRFAALRGKIWLLPAFAAWIAVGLLAESRGRIAISVDKDVPAAPPPSSVQPVQPVTPEKSTPPPPTVAQQTPVSPSNAPTTTMSAAGSTTSATAPTTTPPPAPGRELKPPPPEPPWAKITKKDTDEIDYNVPPDNGIVAPFASSDDLPEDFLKEQVDQARDKIPTWLPGSEPDELKSIRNLLYIAAVPDAIQLPVERYLPRVVYEHLIDTYPKDKLIKVLTYIVQHPEEGIVIDDISDLGIEGTAGDPMIVRERAYLYAIKFIARLTGKRTE